MLYKKRVNFGIIESELLDAVAGMDDAGSLSSYIYDAVLEKLARTVKKSDDIEERIDCAEVLRNHYKGREKVKRAKFQKIYTKLLNRETTRLRARGVSLVV